MIYHWNDPQLEALAKTIPPPDRTPNDWEAWCVKVRILLTHHFPSDLGEFNKIAELGSPPFPGIVLGRNTRQADVAFQRTSDNHYKTAITRAQPKMLALLESIDRYHPTTALAAPAEAALDVLLRLLDRFPQVARQLQHRRSDRGTLRIDDEYDVQDLLHALLLIDFEDVRDEEAAPS